MLGVGLEQVSGCVVSRDGVLSGLKTVTGLVEVGLGRPKGGGGARLRPCFSGCRGDESLCGLLWWLVGVWLGFLWLWVSLLLWSMYGVGGLVKVRPMGFSAGRDARAVGEVLFFSECFLCFCFSPFLIEFSVVAIEEGVRVFGIFPGVLVMVQGRNAGDDFSVWVFSSEEGDGGEAEKRVGESVWV